MLPERISSSFVVRINSSVIGIKVGQAVVQAEHAMHSQTLSEFLTWEKTPARNADIMRLGGYSIANPSGQMPLQLPHCIQWRSSLLNSNPSAEELTLV
jgi:hypothetical protein